MQLYSTYVSTVRYTTQRGSGFFTGNEGVFQTWNSTGDTNTMNLNKDSLGYRECAGQGFFTGKWIGGSGTSTSMPDSARDMAYGVDPDQKTRNQATTTLLK